MSEMDRAVEDLVRRSNGREKTINDLFDLVCATNNDSKARDAEILTKVDSLGARLDKHIADSVHCNEDEEISDIRRVWRVGKWAIAIAAIPLLTAVGQLVLDIFR